MTDKNCIKYRIYDGRLYNSLMQKPELTEEEKDYCSFCYHYEEFRAYGEV